MQTVVRKPGQPPRRIGRFGVTSPEPAENIIAGIAAFILTLDLVLAPLAIISFVKL
jgi:hypothetical protein